MSAISVATVRARIASAISVLAGWTESRYPPSMFRMATGGGAGQIHHTFSVEPQGTTPDPAMAGQRQRLSEGVRTSTSITVHFAHRLRADAATADYDSAWDAVELIVKTVMGISLTNLHIALERVLTPMISPSGEYFIAELRFIANHRLALQ